MNTQPIEKADRDPAGLLQVHHLFKTMQGEGPFAGRPTVFIRLAGCNLQCPLCDTDYTSQRDTRAPNEILKEVQKWAGAATLVVITGGEPFRQNIGPLTRVLMQAGFDVQVETNGTLYLPGFPYEEVTIVCSPKAGKVHAKLWPHVDALKYVLHADHVREEDGLPITALNHSAYPYVARPPKDFKGKIYLQPVDEGVFKLNNRHLKATMISCQKFNYTLCLQLHKLLSLE